MKKELTGYIFGELSLAFYLAFVIFSLFGAFLSMLLHLNKKKKNTFSYVYWWKDNWVRLVWCILFAVIVGRFFYEMETWLKPIFMKINLDYKLNMLVGLLIGFFSDKIIIRIRNKSNLNLFQTKQQ